MNRCDRIRRVFGGHGGETQQERAARHLAQMELAGSWPELHEVLMESIGLNADGSRRLGDARGEDQEQP